MSAVDKDLFRSLLAYKSIMAQTKVLLRRGIITKREYSHFDTMFTKKTDYLWIVFSGKEVEVCPL